MARCPSCDGIIGIDCFNPDECAWIEMEQKRQKEKNEKTELINLRNQVNYLTQQIEEMKRTK